MDQVREQEHAAALMARIRTGDESALTDLMHIYTPRLCNIAVSLLGRRDLAVQAAQDTFVALWRQRERLSSHENIPGYLVRTVRNRSLDMLKAERRYEQLLDKIASGETDWPTEALSDADSSSDDADTMRALRNAIQSLPESPRRVLMLHWYTGMSYAEIAELLGIKVATVHTLMYRALSSFRRKHVTPD